jgi:TetR/AcrR family transcriptional regulator, transcriptional repressor for nem operon
VRYPAEQTAARHERILREASRLFRQRGLNGVSVPQIMKAARLTHGPFYNHFESKEALVAESIERAMADTVQYIASFTRPNTARRQFLDAYLSPRHRDNPGEGCPVAALARDVAHNPAARIPFTRGLEEVLSAISTRLTSDRSGDPRGQAIGLLVRIVGALILARAVDDPALSEEILAQARADI